MLALTKSNQDFKHLEPDLKGTLDNVGLIAIALNFDPSKVERIRRFCRA